MEKTFSSFHPEKPQMDTLSELISLSAVQSFAQILIHNVILFINTSTMLGTTKIIPFAGLSARRYRRSDCQWKTRCSYNSKNEWECSVELVC